MILLINKFIKRIKKIIELSKYNDFTIADYFRKQGAIIGNNNRIEIRTLSPEPYLIKIGNHCTIAPGVSFLTHDGGTWIFTEEIPEIQKFGIIEILDNCFIGMNSLILSNIKIGPNSIVGAGAVVTKDVSPGVIVAGNPARVISTIDEYKAKVIKNWDIQKPSEYFKDMSNNAKYDPAYIQYIKFRDAKILKEHLEKIFWKS